MHKHFDHTKFEGKWQKEWKETGLYDTGARDQNKEKEYILVELPYPSGNLHIGHWYAFALPDIYVRYRRMQGKQVVYPMGFDAFGLPAENAAIKRSVNPREWTEGNIEFMKTQLESMGAAFSWDKTASTIDPAYYKWTQWMFTKFFENDIAYRGEGVVNWCPFDHTVIANEQVLADGTCERCGNLIEKKTMAQWMLRITDYANELIDDLDGLNWPEHIKEAQRQWIGRSKGAEIDFEIKVPKTPIPRTSDVLGMPDPSGEHSTVNSTITVFTTRPDTLFGATYLVLAPEHVLIKEYKSVISNWDEVATYIQLAKQKDDIERGDNTKEKTGVKLEGITATNPASGEEIPVYIADYVLAGYGTGAIMAVPAHDERDNAFAMKFDLPIKRVVSPVINKLTAIQRNRTGVYGLIHNPEKGYLLQYFKNKNYYWLPGGGLEEGESEVECLHRELIEETGYQEFEVKNKISEPFYDFTDRNGNYGRNKSNIYLVELLNEKKSDIKLTEDEISDGLELVWVSEDKLAETLEQGEPTRSEFIAYILNVKEGETYTQNGVLVNSGEFNGMDSEAAKIAITKKVGGRMTNTYRLRDWSIGRQRYWGVPIPIVYDPTGKAHAVPKEHLPWLLPEDVDCTPTGLPPLSKSLELKERTERIFGMGWTPEVETMDTFVDSSWYFMRYMDNQNDEEFASLESQKDWLPIDMYFGGAEHTTMHLLYSRFWQKALHKLGLTAHNEPYARRANHGMILGPDGNKMSKSKGNVIDPDEQVKLVGSDTVRMYLAFMGPYENSSYPWDGGGVAGLRRFLERVYGLREHIIDIEPKETSSLLHKTIKKVVGDIEAFKFNTAISALMIFINQVEKTGLTKETHGAFIKLLAPFAPHLTEEIWHEEGETNSIHSADFPTYDFELAKEDTVTIGVQINGKHRGEITISTNATQTEAEAAVASNDNLSARLLQKPCINIIYVPGRILNYILKEEAQ